MTLSPILRKMRPSLMAIKKMLAGVNLNSQHSIAAILTGVLRLAGSLISFATYRYQK
jgi:hypothetical protein